jgi:hypothetical protein
MSILRLLERILPLLPLIEGIEDEAAAAGAGGASYPKLNKQTATHNIHDPEIYKARKNFDAKEQDSIDIEMSPGLAAAIKSKNDGEILIATKNLRNKEAIGSFDAWMEEINSSLSKWMKTHAGSEEEKERNRLTMHAVNKAIEEYKNYFQSFYEKGIAWEHAMALIFGIGGKKGVIGDSLALGPVVGGRSQRPYIREVISNIASALAKKIINKIVSARAAQQQAELKPGETAVPAERTMETEHFKKYMEDLRKMHDMYYKDDEILGKADEADWAQLAHWLASPTDAGVGGGPIYIALQKYWNKKAGSDEMTSPTDIATTIVRQFKNIVSQHDSISKQKDAAAEKGKGAQPTVDPKTGKVTSLAAIPKKKPAEIPFDPVKLKPRTGSVTADPTQHARFTGKGKIASVTKNVEDRFDRLTTMEEVWVKGSKRRT